MRHHLRTLLIAATIMAPEGLHASIKYWDGANLNNATTDGGSGTWTTTGSWDATLNGANANWRNNDDAIFGGTAGTVSFTGAIQAHSLTFNTTGYIITGTNKALSLTGTNPFISTDAGVTATISSILGGTIAWSKTGDGTLILTNTGNTNAAATTVSAGTLRLGAAGVIADATALTIDSRATFDLNGFTETIGSLSGGGNVTLGGGTITVGGANTSTELSGVISGTGGLIKTGSGTLTLSGNNTYTGVTAIRAGALSVASLNSVAGGAASSGLGAPSSALNGTIALGAITVAGTLIYTGTGETTDRVINLAGTSGGGVIDQSGTGTLKFTSSFTATGGGDKTLTLRGSTDGTGEIAGTIVNNSASNITSVTKSGTGTWLLSGNNTYTGTTTVSAGVLNLQNSGALGSGGATSITAGAAIELQGGINITGHTLSLTGSGVSNAGALRNISGDNTYGGAITVQNAPLSHRINSDSGTLTLSGAIGETGNTTKTILFGGDGNITVSGVISGAGAQLVVTKDGAGTLTLSGTSANTYTALTTVNAGQLTLAKTAAVNAIGSGGISVTGGTLALGENNQITDTAAVTVSGGTFNLGGFSDTVGAVMLTAGNITGTTGVLTGSSYAMESGSASAILAGAGALTKTTAGTVTLSRDNTYTGATTVSAGILEVVTLANGGTASSIGQSTNIAANLVINDGTLRYTGAGDSTNRLMTFGANGGTIDASGTGAITFANTAAAVRSGNNTARTITLTGSNTGDNVFALSLGDNGAGKTAFIKAGVGKWILSAISGYTGTTTVNAGTLLVNGSIAGSATSVNAGGTLGGTGSVGALTLNSGAFIAPGATGLGTLNATSLTWNGGGVMKFDLGLPNETDLLALSGAFTKGAAGTYVFDFLGTGTHSGVYTLITAGSVAGFTAANFSYTNLSTGNTGVFSISGNNLVLTVVPEPQAYALGLAGGVALLAGLRRRKRA